MDLLGDPVPTSTLEMYQHAKQKAKVVEEANIDGKPPTPPSPKNASGTFGMS